MTTVNTKHFRSDPANVAADPDGWAPLDEAGEWEYTAIPLLDTSQRLSDGQTPICAQLNYAGCRAACERLGLEMLTADDLEHLRTLATRGECIELPAFTNTPTAETSLSERVKSDEGNRANLRKAGYRPGMRVAGFGKEWIAGAPAGRAWLMGWWVPSVGAYGITTRSGPGFVQPRPSPGSHGAHDEISQADDGTNSRGKRRRGGGVGRAVTDAGTAIADGVREVVAMIGGHPLPPPQPSNQGGNVLPPTKDSTMASAPRSTIRVGGKGPDVTRWQTIIGVTQDGSFGPGTEAATKAWQAARGLVADGVVGQKCWEAVGETFKAPVVASGGYVNPSAPACLAALRSANAAWPRRKRISDGIMGDARHMAGTSDHNVGNAVDITHDPDSGCDGNIIAELAIKDPRSTYVIWNARIYSKARAAEGWRKYTGANLHKHHCHISVAADKRADASPWEWERLYGPAAGSAA